MEQLIIGVFEQGFIYAIMALGVYITYKILDFPDLSVDSTFPLGAAVTTVMLSSGKNQQQPEQLQEWSQESYM